VKSFEVLKAIEADSSTKAKEALLKRGDSYELRSLLDYTYNPFITFRVNTIDYPDSYNVVQPDVSVELFALCHLLSKHTTTPAAARGMVKNLLAKCTEDNAKFVIGVFQKDLKIGIGVTLINKAFPDLIPDFKVQLALPMEKYDKKKDEMIEFWSTLQYPVIIEEKFDGMRIIAVCDGESVKFFSREGLEYDTLDYLAPQILALRPGTKFVLDGEALGIKYNPNCKVAKKNFDAGLHWEFAQGLSMVRAGNMGAGTPYPAAEMREFIGYMVWDVIDYDFFNSSGARGTAKTLKDRKIELATMFMHHECNPLPNVLQAESGMAFCREDIKRVTDSFIANGGEGSMVKRIDRLYEFKRSDAVLKVKEFKTADLLVTDAFEGKPGTKYEGMLGGVVVSDGDVTSEVGSGFDDDQRVELWLRHLRGGLKGSIFEIQYFEITADNSLRLPTFLRERPDKKDCSWN
jgi:ATP-dependent DNA ligase